MEITDAEARKRISEEFLIGITLTTLDKCFYVKGPGPVTAGEVMRGLRKPVLWWDFYTDKWESAE